MSISAEKFRRYELGRMNRRTQQRQNAPPEFFFGSITIKIFPILVGTVWFWVSHYESKSLKFLQRVSLPLPKTYYFCQVWLNQTFKGFIRVFTDFQRNIMLNMCVVMCACSSWIILFFWAWPVRIRVRVDPPHPLCVARGDLIRRSFGWDRKNRGPVSQQVWHDKDPSMLKGSEHRT
jgi:hypothetical protein